MGAVHNLPADMFRTPRERQALKNSLWRNRFAAILPDAVQRQAFRLGLLAAREGIDPPRRERWDPNVILRGWHEGHRLLNQSIVFQVTPTPRRRRWF